ncbi:PREDICTED: MICOS complex subunit MIC27 [Propithecus coquereli]|uniref:MICOS complex subunit MIC27 n=1 Tax=Propithecus coquereli TaxID=379532 RepID=UPI00063EDAAD|nr:PREDICTED: MICOS complex subunit MIC27 [Propithecus coquereli]
MGKLTTMPAGLINASVSVHAAREEEYKKQLMKPEQLPIYTAPPLQSKYVEEQPGHLQMSFASIRTTAGRYVAWCEGVYVFVKNGIMDTVQFGKDAYVYLKNPPQDFLPKMGVITVSGLVGFVSSRKGSRFKKITYPLGLAALGATVCYPIQSVIIAKDLQWTLGVRSGSSLVAGVSWRHTPADQTHGPDPVPLGLEWIAGGHKREGATQFMPDPKLMDHGQSHPEDVDMYSTRS